MLRLYDFECARGHKQEHMIDVPAGTLAPRSLALKCRWCRGRVVPHDRVMPLTAKYLGDRHFSPRVSGGQFDTVGKKRMPKMPTIPDGATDRDVVDIYRSSEWKEKKAARRAVQKENDAKRKRAEAGVSFRHHPLPGDPKLVG